MKNVFIIGARGYHSNYGGWETFVSNLVDNYNDSKTTFYISELSNEKSTDETIKSINGVNIINTYVKNSGSVKMFIYTIKSYLYTLKYIKKNNINNCYIYILGLKLGPLLILKKNLRKKHNIKIIVNPDGLEHRRSKWNKFIRTCFLLSEWSMLNNCDLIICDALGIKEYVDNRYPKLKDKTTYIAYGTNKIDFKTIDEENILKEYDLKKDHYCLMVGRCVKENNYELVINDFMNSKIEKDLVIITNLSSGNYYNQLLDITKCQNDKRIKFINGVYDQKKLATIRKNAYLYIHGHSVGGTNPSLIEALSITDLNILYDVCFNHDIGNDSCLYFKEKKDLTKLLNTNLDSKKSLGKKAKEIIEKNFTWQIIVDKYKKIFK